MPEIIPFLDPHDDTLRWGVRDGRLVFRRQEDTAWTPASFYAFDLTPQRVALWNALLNRATPLFPDVLRPIADALGLEDSNDVPDVVRQEHAALIAYRNAAWSALRALGVAWGDDATMATKLAALVPLVSERTALRAAARDALVILGYEAPYAHPHEVLCERLIERVKRAKALADNHVQLDAELLRAVRFALDDVAKKLGVIRETDDAQAVYTIGNVAYGWRERAIKYTRIRDALEAAET